VPVSMWSVMVVMAVICIALGIACPWVISNLVGPAQDVLSGKSEYIIRVLGSL